MSALKARDDDDDLMKFDCVRTGGGARLRLTVAGFEFGGRGGGICRTEFEVVILKVKCSYVGLRIRAVGAMPGFYS